MHKEVVRDVQTAHELEQELQLSHAQHGVAVLDVYSAEWGRCKSLSETFRRLHMDAGDQTHLRFFSVECNGVLESLKHPENQRSNQRPKSHDVSRETLADFWKDMVVSRRGKSKPYFVFYKEGTKRTYIEGVNTPKIINYVRELCLPQVPVNESITNEELLKFWETYFCPEESEIFWDSFVRVITNHLSLQRPLRESEEVTLARAIGIEGYKVSAKELEAWVGNEQTIKGAFLETLPSFKEETPKPRETKPAVSPSEAGAANEEFVSPLNERTPSEISLSSDAKYINQLRRGIGEVPLALPEDTKRLVLLPSTEGHEEAEQRLQQIADLPTLQAYLTSLGVSQVNTATICHAANARIEGDSIAFGKLAFILSHCEQSQSNELIGFPEDFRDRLLDGTFFQTYPSVAFTTLCTCTSQLEESELFYNVGDMENTEFIQSLNEGDDVVLPPFVCMRSSTESSEDTACTLKLMGVPKAVRTIATSGETLSFSHWFSTFKVTEKSEKNLGLTFQSHVEGDRFDQCVESYARRLIQDEEQLSRIVGFAVLPDHILSGSAEVLSSKVSLSAYGLAESCAAARASDDNVGNAAAEGGVNEEEAKRELAKEPEAEYPTEDEPAKEKSEEYPTEDEPAKEKSEEYPTEDEPAKDNSEEHPIEAEPEKEKSEEYPTEAEPEKENSEEHPIEAEPEKENSEEHPIEAEPEKENSEEHPIEAEPEKDKSEENPVETEIETKDVIDAADPQSDRELQQDAELESAGKENQEDNNNKSDPEGTQKEGEPHSEFEELELGKEGEEGATGEDATTHETGAPNGCGEQGAETVPETNGAKGGGEDEFAHELGSGVAEEAKGDFDEM